MNTYKIKLKEKEFGKTLRDILISRKINPEYIILKEKNKFIPISKTYKKEVELEVLEVIKM
ncbi:MAG: hypothetical protein PHR26_02965 [Candidatus ainarchaeum sp.]|nr:hypothetical protein [Candidatus ainarchaeum sp.]MDD3975568.1 hypothetical protein [Candidatus ainarchaeum sp.]